LDDAFICASTDIPGAGAMEISQASAEKLPLGWPFDCVVRRLFFCCIIRDPVTALQEVRRVLKPGGVFLLIEHVRAQGRLAASIQNLMYLLQRVQAAIATGIVTLDRIA